MTDREVKVELFRRRAQKDLLAYLHWVWWWPPKTRPLRVGRHTRELCARLTKAVEDFREGKSTYLIVNMPFRHGKSDIVSRALPAYFLGRCRDFQPDVIMSGYGTSLVKGFSKKTMNIMRSKAYQQLFPGVLPDPVHHAAEEWNVEGSQGTVVAAGLGGSITGKGGNLIIVDDYCKNREDAESKTIRDKTWASFTDDLMTRENSPACIVIVCATRWHEDDIVGRIYDEMDKNPDYTQFESLIFPARKAGEWDYLFPELYGEAWYMGQRSRLGVYGAAALLDCDPVSDALKVFRESWLRYYDTPPPRHKMNVYFLVDSANAKKSAKNQDPDYTVILVVGYGQDRNFYWLDGMADRANLTERTNELFRLVRKWRPNNVFWEQVGAMSDVAHIEYVQDKESYRFPIMAINQTIAKDTRIKGYQPILEAGRWIMPKTMPKQCLDGNVRDLVDLFRRQLLSFPGGRHDDIIDDAANVTHKDVIANTSFPQEADEEEYDSCVTEWRRAF